MYPAYVSTLLEILALSTTSSGSTKGILVFQPFLRFWLRLGDGPHEGGLLRVSTLLEILASLHQRAVATGVRRFNPS